MTIKDLIDALVHSVKMWDETQSNEAFADITVVAIDLGRALRAMRNDDDD